MWLIPQVQKLPRVQRFTLAEHIQSLALDFQDNLVAAGKSDGASRHDRYFVHRSKAGVARRLVEQQSRQCACGHPQQHQPEQIEIKNFVKDAIPGSPTIVLVL
jgi:hypothetical protein